MEITPIRFVAVLILLTLLLVGGTVLLHLVFRITFSEPPQTAVDAEPSVPHIVIDAGHGGRDGGASGPNGILEKDLTLSVSLLLADYLRARGYEVVLTRTDDVMMSDGNIGTRKMQDMRYRLTVANQMPGAVFLSIHMNRNAVASCVGSQVYYSSNDERSRVLAQTVQETVASMLQPQNKRGIKEAGSSIYLLDRLEIPAVLVECGFLSNREEAYRLSDRTYQRQLAFSVGCAIDSYFSN